MRRTTKAGVTMISAAALVLAACGDVPTEDRRGYTKAPLEDPGLTITSEGKTEVSEFAQPQLPQVVEIPPPGEAAGAEAGSGG